MLPSSQAVGFFDSVCGGSLPDFDSAQNRMASAGYTVDAATGTVFSATYESSFKVLDGPGFGRTCSFVFGSAERPNQVNSVIEAAFGPIRVTPLGRAVGYQNGRTIIIINEPRRAGGFNYYNLRMWSER